ncbi:LysR family transcriptional regulator [Streptomyces sp. NPDC005438]|uniref:LysR family transcriptional regulator n=1 Tax=Streptomyces sp. NPDC005438 TaxID=3156880 RepID=UPI0033AD48BF
MIDVRRLRVLRAVAHYGTVTAAAEALHFTPSAASQQIRQLGRELDVTLLEPHGRRVRLTPAALGLLEHADAIEARWERAEAELRMADRAPAGLLRLAGFPVAVSRLLAPTVAALRERHPRLTARVRELEPHEAFDELFDGEVDLTVVEAVASNPPSGDSRFDQRPLLDDPFDLLVHQDHPLAARDEREPGSVALADAAREEFVLSMPGVTCREHVMSACGAAGFNPQVSHYALEWNAVANLVAHDLGVALVPRLACLSEQLPVRRVRLGSAPRPRRKLITVTRSGADANPAVTAALEELERVAGQLDTA